MRNPLAGLALGIAVCAAVAGGVALVRQRATITDLETRVEALDAKVDAFERDTERRRRDDAPGPSLVGSPSAGRPSDEPFTGPSLRVPRVGPTGEDAPPGTAPAPTTPDEIQEIVEEAVEKKAEQMRLMATNKKPSIDLFARTLALTDAQRRATEEAVVRSQHEIREILQVPTEDGSVLLDELVEVMAQNIADPAGGGPRWQKIIGRLLTEEVPGTGETYAVRADAVKDRLRETFRRDWTEEQYQTFQAWEMDPTEVQEIPGSPWKEVEEQVYERARALGAEIPETEGS